MTTEDGAVRVTASRDGRPVTLDPIVEHDLTIRAKQVESSIAAGFRQEWVAGEAADGVEFDLTVGAGLGSPYLILTVKFDGRSVEEVVDIREVLPVWVDAVVERERPTSSSSSAILGGAGERPAGGGPG